MKEPNAATGGANYLSQTSVYCKRTFRNLSSYNFLRARKDHLRPNELISGAGKLALRPPTPVSDAEFCKCVVIECPV
jgi:hypothetical protein